MNLPRSIYTHVFLLSCFFTGSMMSCTGQKNEQQKEPVKYTHPIPFAPKSYICYKTNKSLTIDGKPLESEWQKAPWTESFVDIEGGQKAKPKFDTKVKMLWDENYFYFYAQMEEPHVWGKLTERDAVMFYDDDFEIFIDPDGDSHGYYEFEVNALNALWDLLLLKPYRAGDGPKAIDSWDSRGIHTAVHVEGTINKADDEDQYWAVEWAIPWVDIEELASQGKKPTNGDQWRVNFSRVDWSVENIQGYPKKMNAEKGKTLPEKNWVWSPTGRINMHMPEMWGYVQFSDQEVGQEKVKFNEKADEKIKWCLWQMYFMMHQYKEQNGTFTTALESFQLPKTENPNCSFDPMIQMTDHTFIIKAKGCGGTEWMIREDGKIKKIKE